MQRGDNLNARGVMMLAGWSERLQSVKSGVARAKKRVQG